MYKIMTPGPTTVRENVRLARSIETTNPDVDTSFCEEYKAICEKISSILHTKNETFILSGEGILGLEAACASLTQVGDSVLVLDNGIYGKGFADFVSMYGGVPTLYTVDDRNPISVDELAQYLKEHHDFKYATVVHCDTPSGMKNDVEAICRLLKEYGILSVVDSVSAMFGEDLNVEKGQIDVVCGGSQKALSAPIGLTFVTLSDQAKKAMVERNTPIASFYCNLTTFFTYYEDKWFPYTMPISDIYGLRQALDNIDHLEEQIKRHEVLAKATRETLKSCGLKLYLEDGFCNTVTVFEVPENMKCQEILNRMKKEYNILISGSFGTYEDKVIRIGHMGENATVENMVETMEALGKTLMSLGMKIDWPMEEIFREFCGF